MNVTGYIVIQSLALVALSLAAIGACSNEQPATRPLSSNKCDKDDAKKDNEDEDDEPTDDGSDSTDEGGSDDTEDSKSSKLTLALQSSTVTYDGQMKSIISAKCYSSFCHPATGTGKNMNLTTFTAVMAVKTDVARVVADGSMPLSGSPTLTADEKSNFAAWATAGFPERANQAGGGSSTETSTTTSDNTDKATSTEKNSSKSKKKKDSKDDSEDDEGDKCEKPSKSNSKSKANDNDEE